MRRSPWYASGLRFSCIPECGACCTRHEDYAYVYLTAEDIRRISKHLGLTRRDFLNEYTVVDDGEIVLKMVEPECPLLDGWRCTVYEVRPVQCRTFPFWKENLRSRAAWTRVGGFCPGVGEGEVVSLEQIKTHVRDRDGES
ncbi:MAG: YkgJ family cysteine cluster protein [Acidobacteriota bacterium]|nr:YkgJ family cysteine cluster protein [Acidobacteriota bacterium]